jgi:predicted nucleic acid-binding protein
VVLDTNVYISAFVYGRGAPFVVWQHARRRTYRLLVSPAMIREAASVLRESFGWADERIVYQAKLIARVAEIVSPTLTLAVFQGAQEPDNRILECAIAGKRT